MLNAFQQKANRAGDNVFAASRQVWLAGLGAAVVARDWAEKEASGVFRTLVKEGTAVESRAIRLVGDQVESSVTKANVVLKRTRATIGRSTGRFVLRITNRMTPAVRSTLVHLRSRRSERRSPV